jgi:hypothetical protein
MRMYLSTHQKASILKLGDSTGAEPQVAEPQVADPQSSFKEFKTELPDLLRAIRAGRNGSIEHIRLGVPDGRSPKHEPRDTPIPRDTPLPNEQHKATPKPKPDLEQNVPIPRPRPKGI